MRLIGWTAGVVLPALLGWAWASPAHAADPPAGGEHKPTAKELRGNPPLVLAPGPTIGPHAIGNEECRPQESQCETTGSFFGAGIQLEVRPRLYKIFYGHVRPFILGNAAPNKVYAGAWGAAAGLGVYGQHIFGRAEYVFIDAFGDNTFAPPFFTTESARDEWGHHAGALAIGFRKQVKGRVGLELWGGPMFGPRSTRLIPGEDPERRTLITFMLGFNVSIDVVKAR